MPTVKIAEPGCRGCSLCVDLCPVAVFTLRGDDGVAEVQKPERCIGCLTCFYACPAQCVEVGDYLRLRPFHRIEEHAALVRKFLQEQPLVDELSAADVDEAWDDVNARLHALADTVTETIGTGGYRAVARRAGALAATHMPEMYEQIGFDQLLEALRRRFRHALQFDFVVSDADATLDLKPCGLCRVVESRGGKVGEAVLCQLFHEYWAGLVSAFLGRKYQVAVPAAGASCRMELRPVAN